MKAPAALLFVLCPLHSAAASETPTSLHLLKSYPDATCLDGSPAAYYLREGSGSNADKWAFSLEGGGECVTQSECDDRKNGNLGSSANYPSTTTLHSTLQTSDASINPNFHDYNQVFVKYCTGDLHMGQQTASSPPTLDGVYFAGHHVVAAVIKDLMASNNLADAAEVVWSGESAGGMGCFNSLDFVADTLADAGSAATVVGVPVGGFYYPNDWPYNGTSAYPAEDYIPWTWDALSVYRDLWDAFVPARCAASLPSHPERCMLASGGAYETLATPVFVVEAQTDKVVMPLHDGLPDVWNDDGHPCYNKKGDTCPAEIQEYMLEWSGHMVDALQAVAGSNRDGVFNPACLLHTEFSDTWPILDGMNYVEALQAWLDSSAEDIAKHVHIDDCGDIFCNPSCATK